MPAKNNSKLFLRAVSIFTVLLLIAIMAWLSQTDEDPCLHPQSDISGAVLADQEGDKDALINRAMIMKENCKKD